MAELATIARPYAQAIFSLAKDDNQLAAWSDQLRFMVSVDLDRQVQTALANALVGRTSLVIAHRLSTIRNADVILVLDDGRIQQRGTHEELLREGGLYADLYATQYAAAA